ncbi:MAG: primosomal protein N' [Polyangiaceae bacterium]|nr:primosomal protein N' [Polyangiaceae bacterium]
MLLAEVAIPVPLAHGFTYQVPDALAAVAMPGVRVTCRFQRRQVIGVVLSLRHGEPSFDPTKLRPIDAVIDQSPCVPQELLQFLREMAGYYLAPIGEVLRAALPALERSRARELHQLGLLNDNEASAVGGRRVQFAVAVDAHATALQLRGSLPQVLAHLRSVGEARLSSLEQLFPSARAAVRRLEGLGLARVEQRELPSDPYFREPVERDEPPMLNAEQHVAVDSLVKALRWPEPASFLLHGVTGSGKTEVYLRAIAECLAQSRGALVLVPEIALTPQLVARFRARFGDGLAVLHSALSDRARYDMWKALRDQQVYVAMGARSAIFAPVPNLGLVIVDEEHDASFKQEEGLRYHGRDMALLRAARAESVCVLGSATPSLESEALARSGKVVRLRLSQRASAAATLPTVELVDLRRTGPLPSGHPLVSVTLHRAIEQCLAQKQQVILFLNRRGFAPSVLCEACGEMASCPHCSVSLTLHRAGGVRLRCHYCDFGSDMWRACPKCGCERLTLAGLGTERLEEVLASTFPSATVARLDRDVAPGTRSEAVIERMRRREADILVGTQLVTKGHDLPDVTLVGVINADAALSLPDFRAAERTFQLLVQVAGRAGRAEQAGKVVVQTRLPDHPVLRFALHHDVDGFVEHELSNRQEAGYPPYTRLALVRGDGADEQRVRDEMGRLAHVARATVAVRDGLVDVLGPSPAPLERLRGRYRYRIMLRARTRPPLRAVAWAIYQARAQGDRLVRSSVDIDPIHML